VVVVVLSVLGAGGPDPLAAAVGRREEAVLDALDRALVLRCPPLAEDVAVMGEGLRRHGGAYHAFGSGPVPWVAAADLARAARRAVERLEHVGASRRAHDVPAAAALPAADLLRAAVPDAPAPAELVALDPDGLRRCLTELLGDARTAAEVAAFHGWAAGLPGSADSAALVAVLGRDPMPPVDALTAALAGRPDSGRP
jgi:hypothetical protein